VHAAASRKLKQRTQNHTRLAVMPDTSPHQITQLLIEWSNGDRAALDKLMPLVYDELRSLARHYMRQERADHTLQTTALVHEAYVRLIDYRKIRWQRRAHFFAIAAQLMRRILVDYARANGRIKRGGLALRVALDEGAILSEQRSVELIALDDALTKLAALDARKSQVVELRFFGGLNNAEVAEVLSVHPNTVIRDWDFAEAWLRREIGE
jgi:RNA polymerase sigma-70 factor (ECF subfamily)